MTPQRISDHLADRFDKYDPDTDQALFPVAYAKHEGVRESGVRGRRR